VDIERKLYKGRRERSSLPLNSFFFRIENDNVIFVSESEKKKFFFKRYDIDKGYKLAVCSMESHFPEDVEIKSFEEVCKFLCER